MLVRRIHQNHHSCYCGLPEWFHSTKLTVEGLFSMGDSDESLYEIV